jgi:hypothetical protein
MFSRGTRSNDGSLDVKWKIVDEWLLTNRNEQCIPKTVGKELMRNAIRMEAIRSEKSR